MNHLLVSHNISISHWSRKHQLKLTMIAKEIGMSLYIETRAGNLCTREYSALQFFGFGAGFISDHIYVLSVNNVYNSLVVLS